MPFGKIESFDLSSRKWSVYVNRVKQFIALNEIKESLHVATLITVVGEATYDLMCDLCAPNKPEEKCFDELIDIVKQHLEPRRSDIAERHIFRQRRQKIGEDLGSYLQHLKHLASTCNFADKLEENLRDQFVSGLASDEMRSRLFAEKELDYKRAVELALALEAAERHAETSGVAAAGASEHASGGGTGPLGAGSVHRIGAQAAAGAARVRDSRQVCWRCGRPHSADRCRFKQFSCDKCGVKGHLRAMCKSLRSDHSSSKVPKRNQFFLESDSESEDSDLFSMCVDGSKDKPYVIQLYVQNVPLVFEIDTGSKISAINEHLFKKYFRDFVISSCNLKLRSYTGDSIKPLGFITVSAHYYNSDNEIREAHALPLYIIPGGGPPLLGRAWLRRLQLKSINIKLNHLKDEFTGDKTERIINNLKNEFVDVFAPGLGTCTKRFTLKLKDNEPIFHKARNLPLSLKKPVEQELERLVNEGTIARVENSEYGTPIVPVIKKCGSIRICGDYKVTINPKLKREPYPLPRIEELYAVLSGGTIFSKIDLSHAYEQVILTEESRACTTISTHVGTFEYIRTPYGLSCIPEKFQKLMEEVVRGVPNTVVFLDDICCSGTEETHLNILREVFRRLQNVGLRIKLEKCEFFKKSVCYLGHIIDKSGLHPDDKKVKAITNAPRPQNIHQLKAFLGLVNYYGKFIPNLSKILHPLYSLLQKNMKWYWSHECEQAYANVKKALSSDTFLAHYDPSLPLILSVDSSAYGLGGVLAHRYPDGSEKPICYVSRTLNEAEKSYSQLDKEALAIFFGVTKNHQYLFGRSFIIRTDHKPLSYIFGDKIGIPQTAASRLQRYAARLAAYDFTVEWLNSAQNAPADCLSRLPLSHARTRDSSAHYDTTISYLLFLEKDFPVNYKDIAEATKTDPILRNICKYIMFGWPHHTDVEQEKAYFNRRNNLFVENGCIVYNYRIVIPPKFRQYILRELHDGHLGVVKMKTIARNYVYWPGLDTNIEDMCKRCDACRQQRDAPPHVLLTPWEFPGRPWQRLHADFGEYKGKHYLIIIDAHSKWIEVFHMYNTSAKAVICKLRELFARFGLPSQIVTDNGPPFTSLELKEYFNKNGILHSLTSPYRPKGNGAAENAVKTVKNCIKKAYHEGANIEQALCKMLFQYRNCEHATTGVAPAVALLGRRLRGRLDALRPDTAERVRNKQLEQVERTGGTQRNVGIGDHVYVRNYSNKSDKWVEGQVSEQVGPNSYAVNLPAGVSTRRHIDQMLTPKIPHKKRYSLTCTSTDTNVTRDNITPTPSTVLTVPESLTTTDSTIASPASQPATSSENSEQISSETKEKNINSSSSPPILKRSLRPRRGRPRYYNIN